MKKGQSLKQMHKAERQEALRTYLQERGSVQYVFDLAEKIEDLEEHLDKDQVNRLRIGLESRLKLLSKYLPDLKSVESTIKGDLENPIQIQQIELIAPDLPSVINDESED